MTEWNDHVKEYQNKTGCTFKEALQGATKTYKRKTPAKSTKQVKIKEPVKAVKTVKEKKVKEVKEVKEVKVKATKKKETKANSH